MPASNDPSIFKYEMHPLIQKTYQGVHDWIDSQPDFSGYKSFSYDDDSQRVLLRANYKDAAFNFNLYFPTHYFKICHALQSDQVIGLDRLAAWLRYNPFLTIIDVGCGDGAGSAAVIASLLELRESGQLDPREIQVFCSAIDPNPKGLVIYKQMLSKIAAAVAEARINVNFRTVPKTVSEASSSVENQLFKLRKSMWKQPSLSHAILIMSNLNDILYGEYQQEIIKMQEYTKFGLFTQEPFGEPVSGFICQLFERIDHLHFMSVDTRPENIQFALDQMVESIQSRMDEKGHVFEPLDISVKKIQFKNPAPSYWSKLKKEPFYQLKQPFSVFLGHIHNHDLATDERWKKITTQENLELAWARARQAALRESFFDEIEIRLFEKNLDANLARLHFELENYAIHSGYLNQALRYGFPKNSEKDRPRGLNWLEEEILITAIIQVIAPVLQNQSCSYAYRLSSENSPERGDTEYLYEYWTTAWQRYQQDIKDCAQKFISGSIFKTDIQSYFTRILQDRLKSILRSDLQISERIEWLLELLVSKDIKDHDPGRGLVQGSIGSGFLANLYLSRLDNLFLPNDAKRRHFFRYMDDIVVVIPDPADADLTCSTIKKEIDGLKLEVNPGKTSILSVQDYLITSGIDDVLDEINIRYDSLIDPLWWMNEILRESFKNSSSNDQTWWRNIANYRACLTEVSFYISESQLSRTISRKIATASSDTLVLEIPDLPNNFAISETRNWANQLRLKNPDWWRRVVILKKDLEALFWTNFEFLAEIVDSTPQTEIDKAGRRLRFATNRIGVLGFNAIHQQLTDLFCHKPWIIRYPSYLLENLGRQGFTEDIWTIFNFHNNQTREMSIYMSAIALRALRFAPYLEIEEWHRFADYMFKGAEAICLMASESWLILSAHMKSTPYAVDILANVHKILAAPNPPSRRLLKNYLLILGKLDPSALEKLGSEKQASDPLLYQAYQVAKSDIKSSIWLQGEPDIIRRKYYSTKYQIFDDLSEGSI